MSNPIKAVVNPDNSESVAAGMAALMLGGPMASDQVGQVLTTITGAIGLNPEIAGGVSALYALFRLWKKWRVGRKAAKGAAVGVALLAGLALSPAALAEEPRGIEMGMASVDAEGTDDGGTGYQAAWLEPLGKTGRYSGHVRMQRLTDLAELDAYIVDLDMLANFGMGKRFQAFLGGGLGSVFEDASEQSTTVEVEGPAVGAMHGTTPTAPPIPAGQTELVVSLEDEDAYVRWSAVGGVRVYLDAERRFAVTLEYRRSDSLQDDGPGREQDGFGLSFMVPAGIR